MSSLALIKWITEVCEFLLLQRSTGINTHVGTVIGGIRLEDFLNYGITTCAVVTNCIPCYGYAFLLLSSKFSHTISWRSSCSRFKNPSDPRIFKRRQVQTGGQPTSVPTAQPTGQPTAYPTAQPTSKNK